MIRRLPNEEFKPTALASLACRIINGAPQLNSDRVSSPSEVMRRKS
jgi:hypothetical protein